MVYVIGLFVLLTAKIEMTGLYKQGNYRELLVISALLVLGTIYGIQVTLELDYFPGLNGIYDRLLPLARAYVRYFHLLT